MANTCPQCNTPYDAGAAYCDNCGATLPQATPQAGMPAQAYPAQPAAPMSTPPYAPQTSTPAPIQPAPAYPAVPAGGVMCTQCGAPLVPGAAYCDNCGAPAAAQTPAQAQGYPPPVQPQPYQAPPQQTPYPPPVQQPAYPPVQQPAYGVPPRLVVPGTNAQIMMAPGKTEYIVGREDPVSNIFPDVELSSYGGDEGGVSRRHARLSQQGGQWFVEDFNSTNFTFVNNQRVQPGQPVPVPNGAEIRFGRVKLTFYTQ